MDRLSIIQHLRILDTKHCDDGDGGYALVHAIRDWAVALDREDKEGLWGVLIDLVAQRDVTLWGVALEVLVEESPSGAAVKLAHLVDHNDCGEEWNDQIVLALLRLRESSSVARSVSYIRIALENGRRPATTLLAALCRVDSESFLDLSSAYFGEAFRSDELAERHRGYIPAFVRNSLEVDEHLLRHLVERTRNFDPSSASKLAAMIDECLARPVFAREFGASRVKRLRQEILT